LQLPVSGCPESSRAIRARPGAILRTAGIVARPARRQMSPLLLGFRSELPGNGSCERRDGNPNHRLV